MIKLLEAASSPGPLIECRICTSKYLTGFKIGDALICRPCISKALYQDCPVCKGRGEFVPTKGDGKDTVDCHYCDGFGAVAPDFGPLTQSIAELFGAEAN